MLHDRILLILHLPRFSLCQLFSVSSFILYQLRCSIARQRELVMETQQPGSWGFQPAVPVIQRTTNLLFTFPGLSNFLFLSSSSYHSYYHLPLSFLFQLISVGVCDQIWSIFFWIFESTNQRKAITFKKSCTCRRAGTEPHPHCFHTPNSRAISDTTGNLAARSADTPALTL